MIASSGNTLALTITIGLIILVAAWGIINGINEQIERDRVRDSRRRLMNELNNQHNTDTERNHHGECR